VAVCFRRPAKGKRRGPVHSRSTPTSAKKQRVDGTISDEDDRAPRINKRGIAVTKSGRPSVKANEVRGKFSSSYRNSSNKNELLGRQVTLGKAVSLLAHVLYGLEYPTEKSQHDQRVRLFRSAAYYALTDEEIDEVLEADEEALRVFLMGLVTAAVAKPRYELPTAAREHFQSHIFCSVRKDSLVQEQLGLEKHASILDQ